MVYIRSALSSKLIVSLIGNNFPKQPYCTSRHTLSTVYDAPVWFVSSASKIVKRLRRWKHDPVIMERIICLVFDPSTTLYGSFVKHSTLTNKEIGVLWRDLSKPPQRRRIIDARPLWLLFGATSAVGHELAPRWAEYSRIWQMSLYILIYYF